MQEPNTWAEFIKQKEAIYIMNMFCIFIWSMLVNSRMFIVVTILILILVLMELDDAIRFYIKMSKAKKANE